MTSTSSTSSTSSTFSEPPMAATATASAKIEKKKGEPTSSSESPVETNSVPFPELAPSSSSSLVSHHDRGPASHPGQERRVSSSAELPFDLRSVRSVGTTSSASLNYLDLSRSRDGGGGATGWQSMFKQGLEYVFDWNRSTRAQSELAAHLLAGEKVCAVCPTTEDDKGYFLVVVLEGVRDSSKDYILKVVKLSPLPGQTVPEGKAGHRYACSFADKDSEFWEQESRLLYAPMSLSYREDDDEDSIFLSEIFTLQKSLEEICNLGGADSSSISSDDSVKTSHTTHTIARPRSYSVARPLEFHRLEDGKDEPIFDCVDLDSYVDIMQKCGELVSGLALAVTPSYFNGEDKGPKPKNGFAGEGWKLQEEIGGIEVFSKEDPPSRLTRVMSRCVIEASPTEIKYLVKQSKNREQFDPMCRGIKVVETIDENTVVAHFVDTKYLFNRDFCVIRHNYTTPEGSVYLVSNSVKTPQCPVSEYVRGLVIESGFVMEPRGKGSSLMSYVVQADINLWVPHFVIHQVLKGQVVDVVDQIRHYFLTKRQYETTMKKSSRSEADQNS